MKGPAKMMLGFVVRRCTVELGREPTAAEFAAWANNHGSEHRAYCVFGRAISEDEARVILKHRGRLVSARSASAGEEYREDRLGAPRAMPANVFSFADARTRKAPPARNGRDPLPRRS